MQNNTTFTEQINEAQFLAMKNDPSMICMGLGIDDPKAIFNTTIGLQQTFGINRVFDTPTSENAMTGIGIGAAISGTRVLMTHQRVDFFLLAMDQLVNNAAKWHYMFNGKMKVPLTIRLIVGRGWGQGPTHQQSLQSWFTHIPGLKVVSPGLTENVGQLLYQSIMDDNPVVFLEHRWLHNQVHPKISCLPLDGKVLHTRVLRAGTDFTIITNSVMISEALRAHSILKSHGISAEIIEISSPTNVDWLLVFESVNKTGHCLITEIGHSYCSFASEVSHQIYTSCFSKIKSSIKILGLPHYPEPTSHALTKHYYPSAIEIIECVSKTFGIKIAKEISDRKHDIPGEWFKGPF